MSRKNSPLVRLTVALIVTVLWFAQPKCAAYTTIWADGFDGSLGNWNVVNAYAYNTGINHGSYTGAGSAYASGTAASQMWRSLGSRPFGEGRASAYYWDQKGGYKSGICSVSQREPMRLTEPGGTVAMFLDYGIYSAPSYATYNYRTVGGGGIGWTAAGNRNPGTSCGGAWIYLEITVTPNNPGNSPVGWVKFLSTDGGGSPSVTRDITTDFFSYGMGRFYLGINLSSGTADRRWDDAKFEATTPGAPSIGSATANSDSQITWTWSRADNNLFGFDVADSGGTIKAPEYSNSGWLDRSDTSWAEGGLSSNTQYTRKVRAWNGSLNSSYSGTASAYTLADAPVLNTNVATTAGGGWYNAASWPGFTNPQGFGTGGKVSKFKYKWSTSDSDSIAENAGTDWSSGTMTTAPGSDGTWYLYVRSYNADNKGNGSTRLGPYNYDNTAPTAAAPESVTASTSSIKVNFGDGSDALAGLDATAPYQISRPEGGGWTGSWSADSPLSDPLTGLSGGDEVTYTVKTRDQAGNVASAATIAGRVPPVDSGNAVIFMTKAAMLASPGLYPNDGQIFASSNSVLYGFNSSTPGQLWVPVSTGGSVQGRMPVATLNSTRTVLAGSQDGKVYARNASTGAQVWTHDLGSGYKATAKPAGALNRTITTPSYTGDVVFAVTDKNDDSNFLRAVRADTGATLWTYQPGNLGPIAGSPAVKTSGSGGTVFIACQTANSTGRVAAVNIADGSELWQAVIGSVSSSVGMKGDGSKVYVVNDSGDLYSLDAATGSTESGYPLTVGTQGIYGAPFHVANQNGLLLSCNADDAVKMVSLSGPSVAWSRTITAPSASLEYRSKVYAGSSDGKLYELNIGDGTVAATRTIGYTVGDPVVDAVNSLLYVGATDGGIYSFSLPF